MYYLCDELNFLYNSHYKKLDKAGVTKGLWKCLKTDCPARAFTKQNEGEELCFTGRGKADHNHVADMSKIVKLEATADVRQQALTELSAKPQQLYQDYSTMVTNADEVVTINKDTFTWTLVKDCAKQVMMIMMVVVMMMLIFIREPKISVIINVYGEIEWL